MNTFSFSAATQQASDDLVILGWNAMCAFGVSSVGLKNAEVVADFVAAARHEAPEHQAIVGSFWNSFAPSAAQTQMAMA